MEGVERGWGRMLHAHLILGGDEQLLKVLVFGFIPESQLVSDGAVQLGHVLGDAVGVVDVAQMVVVRELLVPHGIVGNVQELGDDFHDCGRVSEAHLRVDDEDLVPPEHTQEGLDLL